MLNHTVTGEDTSLPPVLLVHGLFGSAKNLGGIARRLSPHRKVVAVDMRNHGESFRDSDQSYAAMAGDLAEIIENFGGIADVVGHSMGGKAAMVLALSHPATLRRLAVLDIAPLAYGHSQNGLIGAMERLDLDGLRLRSEADRRLAETVADAGVRAFLLQSLDLRADPAEWKLNLAVLRATMAQLVGWPQGLAHGAFTGPALFLAGANSDYCEGAGVAAIRYYFPQAQVEFVAGAGHWLHAEQPEAVASRLESFLG